MPGWREMLRRAEEATIPTDALQERGKKAEATILSLKAQFPNWRELEASHQVSRRLAEYQHKCIEMIGMLADRGVEPLFGIGQPMAPEASTSVKAEAAAESEMPKSWQEIEIAFLSDERVEICSSGNSRKTCNYAELGFEDRRSGKPNRAWVALRELAHGTGTIPTAKIQGKELAQLQKRIEEIREKLRGHFKIEADPIPFNGSVYQMSFKISRRPSFDT